MSASLRYARFSSSAVHDGDTPSKTYGSSGVDVDARARREIRRQSSRPFHAPGAPARTNAADVAHDAIGTSTVARDDARDDDAVAARAARANARRIASSSDVDDVPVPSINRPAHDDGYP